MNIHLVRNWLNATFSQFQKSYYVRTRCIWKPSWFSAPPICDFPLLANVERLTPLAQQIKLSGCPTKGHFSAKSGENAFLALKLPSVGQSDNYYSLFLPKEWFLQNLEKDFIATTGIPRIVRVFGLQQTALLEKPH